MTNELFFTRYKLDKNKLVHCVIQRLTAATCKDWNFGTSSLTLSHPYWTAGAPYLMKPTCGGSMLAREVFAISISQDNYRSSKSYMKG